MFSRLGLGFRSQCLWMSVEQKISSIFSRMSWCHQPKAIGVHVFNIYKGEESQTKVNWLTSSASSTVRPQIEEKLTMVPCFMRGRKCLITLIVPLRLVSMTASTSAADNSQIFALWLIIPALFTAFSHWKTGEKWDRNSRAICRIRL